MPNFWIPVVRSIDQLDDPVFRGVLLRSLAWSFVAFAALQVGVIWIIHQILGLHGWFAWGFDVLGSITASLLALWLFLPVAAMIGMLYFDHIALSVEGRYYPWLPPPEGASFLEQTLDGVTLAFKVLVLNIGALIVVLVLPGLGLILGWMIAAYAIGRGMFVAVAMRRMPRPMAESLYGATRSIVLAQGAVLAAVAYLPIVNLLLPIMSVAAMVHVLDMAISAAGAPKRPI